MTSGTNEVDAIIEAYVKDLTNEDYSVLLDEIGADRFRPVVVEDAREAAALLDSNDTENIVNRAFNLVSEPLDRVFLIFAEPDEARDACVYIIKSELCTPEFLRFVEYIHDDVEDEDDMYVPPYEVS